MTDQPGRPGGESTDEPAEGGTRDGATDPPRPDAPHPEEPAEGAVDADDRPDSAQDAP